MNIAKYRDPGKPGKWWLTDFTMGQVEGRLRHLADLEGRIAKAMDTAGSVKIGGEPTAAELALMEIVMHLAGLVPADTIGAAG